MTREEQEPDLTMGAPRSNEDGQEPRRTLFQGTTHYPRDASQIKIERLSEATDAAEDTPLGRDKRQGLSTHNAEKSW